MHLPLQGSHCVVRRWTLADAEAVARNANDHAIAKNLRDAFPFPYTLDDAKGYLASVVDAADPDSLCVEVEGQAAGGIGLKRLTDVERFTAEIGYWLGSAYWNRGIMGEVLKLATPFYAETFGQQAVEKAS